MPQRVCDVWTASWVDCTCLGEPITRDSQDERDQNYPYCLCQEHGGNIADVTGKWQNETCAACMPMNELDQPTVTALGFKRNERLTAMLELVNLFSSTSRHPSVCVIGTHSCHFLVFGQDPNHLLLLSECTCRNAPATYEHQAGLQCNCGDCCDGQLHSSPRPFCKFRCLGRGTYHCRLG